VQGRALGNAIALNSAQFNLSRIIGPSLAGAAIAFGGLALAFWAYAISFLIVVLAIASLPIATARDPNRISVSLWSNVAAGLSYVRRDRVMLALLLLPLVPGVLNLNYIALLPVFARDVLQVGAPGLGLLTAAVGIGALSGALSVAILRPSGGSGRLLLSGLAIASVGLLVFSLSTWLPLSLLGLAVIGFFQVTYYSTTNTFLQLLVPARLRGRVLSLYILTSTGFIPVGNILAGLLAERIGAPATLAGMVSITLVVCGLVALRVPELIALRAETTIRRTG